MGSAGNSRGKKKIKRQQIHKIAARAGNWLPERGSVSAQERSSTAVTGRTAKRCGKVVVLAHTEACRIIWHWREATTSLLTYIDWRLAEAESGVLASFLPR